MKIPKVQYVKFRTKRCFGVELEMNNKLSPKELVRTVAAEDPERPVLHTTHYQQDHNNGFWHVKFDRSCGDVQGQGGWEVASYKASGWKDVEKIGKVADALRRAGAMVNRDCGLHVHVEIAEFSQQQAATLVAYWMKVEPFVCEMLPAHRRDNKYCQLLTKRFASTVSASKVYTPGEFWALVRPQRYDNPNRRVALNMCNFAQWDVRKTTELRLPECDLDSNEVKNWIRFFVRFVDNVRKRPFPESLAPVGLQESLAILGLHSEDPFFILSKALRDTKIWAMKRVLTHSTNVALRAEAEGVLARLEDRPSIRIAKAETEAAVDLNPKWREFLPTWAKVIFDDYA